MSNPTAVGFVPFVDLAELLAPAGCENYAPEPFGLRLARQALSKRWARRGHCVPPERIVLTASTSEAYGFLFKLLCDPGDEVLVPEPSYPLFEHLARLEHVRLVPYRLDYDGAWYLELESVRAAITERTRALLLVSPNNPTGSVVRPEELRALAKLGLPLVADEVFSGFLFGAQTSGEAAMDGAQTTGFVSAMAVEETLVFVLDGLSKSMGLPQCKLAWTSVGGPQELVAAALERLEVIADSYLSVATPVQLALPALLEHEPLRHRVIQARLEENLAYLSRVTRGSAVTLLRLEGGWSAVLQVPRTRSETEWVLGLMQERGVIVQPGWFFDFPREAYLVVSLLPEPGVFSAGLEALVDYVSCG